MKQFSRLATVAAPALAVSPAAALADDHAASDADAAMDESLAGPSGVYGGSYTCQDGEHGIYLEMSATDSIIDPDENGVQRVVGWNLSGVLGFFPTLAGKDGPSGMVAGSFTVEGVWSTEDMSMVLTPGEWILQPENYGAAELHGTLTEIAPGQWQITGKPVVPGAPDFCSNLIATQFVAAG